RIGAELAVEVEAAAGDDHDAAGQHAPLVLHEQGEALAGAAALGEARGREALELGLDAGGEHVLAGDEVVVLGGDLAEEVSCALEVVEVVGVALVEAVAVVEVGEVSGEAEAGGGAPRDLGGEGQRGGAGPVAAIEDGPGGAEVDAAEVAVLGVGGGGDAQVG